MWAILTRSLTCNPSSLFSQVPWAYPFPIPQFDAFLFTFLKNPTQMASFLRNILKLLFLPSFTPLVITVLCASFCYYCIKIGCSYFFLLNLKFLVISSLLTFICFFYWSIVDLQYCVSFRLTAEWFGYIYIYIYIYIFLFLILFHYRLLQDIEFNSSCYTVNPCCLSIFSYFFIPWPSRVSVFGVN